MKIYPQNLTFEVPLNDNDYVRINVDLTINRCNVPEPEFIKNVLDNVFAEIKKCYGVI